jgi:hypothetical protein
MLAAIGPFNKELSECLKKALHKNNESDSANFPDFRSNAIEDTQIIFDKPVMIPCYLLFALAKELGVVDEIYEIILSYGWQFSLNRNESL